VLAVVVIFAGVKLRGPASSAAGYAAKVTCSGVFLSGRDAASIRREELGFDIPIARLLQVEVDGAAGLATASVAGIVKRTAVYRPGLGCTLDSDTTIAELRSQPIPPSPPAPSDPWPEVGLDGVDLAALDRAVASAFEEPDPARPKRTRAIVVIHNGELAAERYAPGFDKDMRLQGWSMTKSLTNALVGILVRQGKLKLNDPAPVPEWSSPTDPRHAITLDQLMRMSSGLEFNEAYGALESDVVVMLFRKPSAAAYAASKPLAHPPDTVWDYSSGTANIISRIVRESAAGSLPDYWLFPRKQLFEPIGMTSVVIEPDPSGTFVGSSFCYATARDWARLGLLYMNDGVVNGHHILPEGWVKYSTTPTPKAPNGSYGAQIWLNAGDPADPARRPWPKAPRDSFAFDGYEGQHAFVVPSRRLVVVRLGLSQAKSAWDPGEFLATISAVFPEVTGNQGP
jgi:CubicO group peptidase (beta-lactamase class C family)